MAWHTIYRQGESAWSWCQEDGMMHVIMKKYEKWLPNGNRIIVEIINVGDAKYRDGIMYTFRCIDENKETVFAVENSHGKPHIHAKGRAIEVDFENWKMALAKFDEMLGEHKKLVLWLK